MDTLPSTIMEVEKWVPPRLVSLKLRYFSTSMIVGERVDLAIRMKNMQLCSYNSHIFVQRLPRSDGVIGRVKLLACQLSFEVLKLNGYYTKVQ